MSESKRKLLGKLRRFHSSSLKGNHTGNGEGNVAEQMITLAVHVCYNPLYISQ